MKQQVTYELLVRDALTGKLKQIGVTSDTTYSKLTESQRKYNDVVRQGGDNVSSVTSRLKGMLATYMTIGAGIMFARTSLNKWNEQVQAEAQVMQGIRSTNMAAGKSFEDLTTAASNFQKKTIFGDESILQNVTAQMLTFTNVTGTAFDRTQQAALDVTSRLYGTKASGESLRATSIMLGKALNDPVANLGALSRAGIQFSDEQTDLIKNLWKTGQTAQAQSILLSELERQYGGSAEAAAAAGLGAWQQFMNRIGDIQEKFGPFLNQILTGLIQLFDWVQKNAVVIGLLGSAILGAVVIYKGIIVATKLWAGATWLLNAAMNANPIMLIVTLIGAMIAAVIYAWYKFDGFRGALFGLWEAFKSVFTGIRDLVKNTMGGVGELITGALTFDLALIQSGLKKLGEGFSNYGKGIVDSYKAGSDAGKAYQPKVPDFLANLTGSGSSGMMPAGAGAGAGTLGNDLITDDATVSGGVSEIIGGGKKQINMSIVIEKMIETFNVQPGQGQTWEDVEDKVMETMMRVINSTNRVAI